MPIISRLLFWVGLLCVAVFFYPSMRHEDSPNGRKDRLSFGIPVSPWYDKHVTVKDEGVSPSGVHMIHEVHVVKTNVYSWSTLCPVLGIVLMVTGRFLKQQRAVTKKRSREAPAIDSV